MCGIAGFIGYNDNLKYAYHANEIQKHRGPDNQSVWSDSYIALAHQRLSIIDLSTNANQPFEKRDYVLVFNGEIYNYRELRTRLEEDKGANFTTSSDTEVILQMYHFYGKQCLTHFIGMFAFVVYNKRTKILFAARDHFGIKPFFYTSSNTTFAFSSELKTLCLLPDFDKSINRKALVSCLTYQWVSGNESIFNGCRKLPPAHFLIYTPDHELIIEQYWQLDSSRMLAEKSADKIAGKLAMSISDSVKRHMVADVPISSFLSGGLDSSLLSVIAQQFNPKLSTYTIGSTASAKKAEAMPDDEKYAQRLAEDYQFDHHVIRITPDIISDLPKMVRTLDEPIGDPAALNTFLICQSAQQQGVKVLISGMGADEVFFGYRRHQATILTQQFNKLPKILKSAIQTFVKLLPVRLGNYGLVPVRWAKRFLKFSDLPLEKAYRQSYSYYNSHELRQLLNTEYWPAIEEVKQEHTSIFNDRFLHDPVNQMCYTDLQMFMTGLNLTYTDRASMAASVEVRVPFIDKKVIEFAMQIPGSIKYQSSKLKAILKKSAAVFIPSYIINRQKASFGAPIRAWISNELRPLVDDLLSEESVRNRNLFNYKWIQQMIMDDRSGKKDFAYQIYQLITIELWFRNFVDDSPFAEKPLNGHSPQSITEIAKNYEKI